MNLETTVLSCRVWLREAEVCSGRQRWSWLRILLETLTALSDTTLWVGASFSPRSLFRRLKGQQLKKTSYREALLFCTLTHTQLRQPGYPTLPLFLPLSKLYLAVSPQAAVLARMTTDQGYSVQHRGFGRMGLGETEKGSPFPSSRGFCSLPRKVCGRKEGSFSKLRG